MHPVLVTILSAVATGFLLTLALFTERRSWRHEAKFPPLLPGGYGNIWNRVLSGILALAILGSLGMVLGITTTHTMEKGFTEFYILGLSGKAEGYPSSLTLGEGGEVIVGVINREHEAMSYRVEVRIDGVINSSVGPVLLERDEKWEKVVAFVPRRMGDKQQVEFLLYKQAESDIFQKLYLWVDVR